jgi:hypothetical protein
MYMYVCMRVWIGTNRAWRSCICMYVCMCVCMYDFMALCLSVYPSVRVYAHFMLAKSTVLWTKTLHTYAHRHIHIHTYMYTHMYFKSMYAPLASGTCTKNRAVHKVHLYVQAHMGIHVCKKHLWSTSISSALADTTVLCTNDICCATVSSNSSLRDVLPFKSVEATDTSPSCMYEHVFLYVYVCIY